MAFINPISASALPAALAQVQLAADKSRQIGRQQVARRVTSPSAADRFEHVVENAEAVAAVRDEPPRREQDAERKQDGETNRGQEHGQGRQPPQPRQHGAVGGRTPGEHPHVDGAPPSLDVTG